MRATFVLALCLAAVAAVPRELSPERIVGGTVTTIDRYPTIAALQRLWPQTGTFSFGCGSSIINTRAFLTAAHCPHGDAVNRWRVRVGSTWANSGGIVHNFQTMLLHPSYNTRTLDSDIAIMRTATPITLNNNIRAGNFPGVNYNLGDNQVVWAAGWGTTSPGGSISQQLRHVQIWTVNQAVCRQRYAEVGSTITDNMLCSGWLDVGGRDQCQGDSGGPLYHNNVIVGVCSWGRSCGLARFPGVNVRVTRFITWIRNNA